MKTIRTGPRAIATAVLACAAAASMSSSANSQRTGSHLDSRAARPSVLHLNRASEIDRIHGLIDRGNLEGAVELAQAHVENLRSMPAIGDAEVSQTVFYDALNALCIALATTGRTDAAIETCSEAIRTAPRRWAA